MDRRESLQRPCLRRDPLFPGSAAIRKKVHPSVIAIIQKSVAIKPRERGADAEKMAEAWEKSRLKTIRFTRRGRS